MPRILLAEDNETNRDMLSRRLTRRGFGIKRYSGETLREPVAVIASPVAANVSPGAGPVAAIVSRKGPPFASPDGVIAESVRTCTLTAGRSMKDRFGGGFG